MAITVDYSTKVITIEQSDLTLISGTLYELDTDAFRLALHSIQDSEEGIWADTMFVHNTEVTVAGTTFARTIEIINGYSVQFEDGQYSVRLSGSNNNLFDVEAGILVQNQVQVIAQNSAGLQTVNTSGTVAPTQQEIRDAMELPSTAGEDSIDEKLDDTFTSTELTRKINQNKFVTDPVTGVATIYDDDDSVLVQGELFEDADGTQPYRGQGAERRERLE